MFGWIIILIAATVIAGPVGLFIVGCAAIIAKIAK